MTNQAREALQTAHQYFATRQLDQATRVVYRALQREPRDPDLLLMMGLVLFENRKDDEARPYYEKAIEIAPQRSDLRLHFGRYLVEKHEVEEAERQYRAGLEVSPPDLDVMVWLGNLLVGLRRYREAIEIGKKILTYDYRNIGGSALLANSYREIGLIDEALANLSQAMEAQPQDRVLISQYLYMLHNSPTATPEHIFECHRQLAARMVRQLRPYELHNDQNPDRRIKIAFSGGEFIAHSVRWFLLPLIQNLDRDQFAIYIYHAASSEDAVTEEYRQLADSFVNVFGEQEEAFIERVRKDEIDILVDIAVHTGSSRVHTLPHRFVPITVNYLGYPDTSGLDVDYRIVDSQTDPLGYERLATETLLRLDPCFLAFRHLPDCPDVAPLPSLSGETFTFGSFNALPKLNTKVLELWGKLLAHDPRYRLVLKNFSFESEEAKDLVLKTLVEAGAKAEQVEFIVWSKTMVEHLEVYAKIDLALDPFPYNGTTTTCEALWMGVPSICLIGDRHSARVSHSLQRAAGIPQFEATDLDQYVENAIEWSERREELADIRSKLREMVRQSPVGDVESYAKRFGEAMRGIWRKWCAS